jgi:hypothetical protein
MIKARVSEGNWRYLNENKNGRRECLLIGT